MHGLGGKPFGTWGGNGKNDARFWPAWIAEDIRGLAVYSLAYEAAASERKGSAMSLLDRGQNVLTLLLAEPALRRAPLAFVGYSLGGLVVKQFLRRANEQKDGDPDTAQLLDCVAQVIFIATPHAGARLPIIMNRFRVLTRPTLVIRDLGHDGGHLHDLNRWYRNFCTSPTRTIDHLVFRETKKIYGQMVVDEVSSDPGVAGAKIIPVDANHLEICKPADREALIYKTISALLEKLPSAKPILANGSVLPAGVGERPKPINLPYRSLDTLFKGRNAFMQRLRASLTRANGRHTAIVSKALYGLGGIGKTRTAIEYAWAHRHEYHALLFVIAETPEALRRNLAELTGPLMLREQAVTDEEVKFAATLNWLKQNPGWLLILDGLDNREALQAAERLMGQITGGHVLLTSRLANFSAHVEPIELDVLSVEDAVDFLMERTQGRRNPQSNDKTTAKEIAQSLGQLALALEHAGAFIAEGRRTFAEYQKQLRENWDKVMDWCDPAVTNSQRAVAATWQTSVARLSQDAYRLLQRLAWLAPEPIPKRLLELVIPGAEAENLGDAFSGLATYSLVTHHVDRQSFAVHRLVQEVTRRGLTSADKRRSLTEAIRWIDMAFTDDPKDIRAWPQLDLVAQHALSVIHHADDALLIMQQTVRLENCIASLITTRVEHAQREIPAAIAPPASWFGDVTKLTFQHSRLEMALETLKDLGNLQNLSLRNIYFGNPAFLAKFANLQNLDLGRTKVIGLGAIAELAELQSLDLWRTKVKDITPLSALKKLHNLSLGHTGVKDVSALAALAHLQSLDLSDTRVAAVSKLAGLTSLRCLNLGGTRVGDVKPLGGLGNLVRLDLSDTRVVDIGPIARLRSLLHLKLNGTPLSNLSPLAGLTSLLSLDVSGTRVRDASPLAGLINLRSLSLGGTKIRDLRPLAGLIGLQSLNLGSTRVSDVGALHRLTALERLDLRGSFVMDVAPLAALTNLRSLDLAHTNVVDLAPLATLTNLQVLHLDSGVDVTALAHIPGLRFQYA